MQKHFATAITIYMTLDVLAWTAWAWSGQTPVDGFYIGAITNFIFKLIY